MQQAKVQSSNIIDSEESEPDIFSAKLNPFNPLLPPGFKNPAKMNGIPISSFIIPKLAPPSHDNSLPLEPTSNQTNKTDKKAGNKNNEEEKSQIVMQKNKLNIKSSFELEFIKNFQKFTFRKTIGERLCCAKITTINRLKKLKDQDSLNEDYKKNLYLNIFARLERDNQKNLNLTSIVDLYMICSVLESDPIIECFNKFLEFVKQSTDFSIKKLETIKLPEDKVLSKFFEKTRLYVLSEINKSKYNKIFQFDASELENCWKS